MAKNYYLILGLTSGATPNEIKAAYRRRAKEYHPDRYGQNADPFLEIQEAYSVPGDPTRRHAYDRACSQARARRGVSGPVAEPGASRRPPVEPLDAQGGAGFGDISLSRSFQTFTPSFDELFDRLWRNFSRMSRPKSEGLESLMVDIPVSPEQARAGGQVRILVPAHATCRTCRGFGAVDAYECWRCAGEGAIAGEYPLTVSFPPGMANDHTVMIPLIRFGIRNLYLSARFRITLSAY